MKNLISRHDRMTDMEIIGRIHGELAACEIIQRHETDPETQRHEAAKTLSNIRRLLALTK